MATIMQHSNRRAWLISKCPTLSRNGSSKMLKSNIMAAKKLSGIEFLLKMVFMVILMIENQYFEEKWSF